MQNYIQANDYELWMITDNGPHIPMMTTKDGKIIPKKSNKFDSNDFEKMEKTLEPRTCCTLPLDQTSTLVFESVIHKGDTKCPSHSHEGTNQVK